MSIPESSDEPFDVEIIADFFVEIVRRPHRGYKEQVVSRMGPMSIRLAERVERGANINLNHKDYFTRIVGEEVHEGTPKT